MSTILDTHPLYCATILAQQAEIRKIDEQERAARGHLECIHVRRLATVRVHFKALERILREIEKESA